MEKRKSRWGSSDVAAWTFSSLILMNLASVQAYVEAGGKKSVPPLVLHWVDPEQHFLDISESVRQEVEDLFGDIGVQVRWNTEREIFAPIVGAFEVRVLLLLDEPARWGVSDNAAGWARGRKNSPSALFVFVPNVGRSVGLRPRDFVGRRIAGKGRWELTRSLSRVIAHELIHAVVPSQSHEREGLMSPHLNRKFLTKSKVGIAPHLATRFRLELIRLSSLAAEKGGDAGRCRGGSPYGDWMKLVATAGLQWDKANLDHLVEGDTKWKGVPSRSLVG